MARGEIAGTQQPIPKANYLETSKKAGLLCGEDPEAFIKARLKALGADEPRT
jgi:hypothetical protein